MQKKKKNPEGYSGTKKIALGIGSVRRLQAEGLHYTFALSKPYLGAGVW